MKKFIGSLIYNKDLYSYMELDGSNTDIYLSHNEYKEFYENVLLKLYRINLKAPSLKIIKEYISKHSHSKTYSKTLDKCIGAVKKGKKALELEDMPMYLDMLKRANLKELLEDKIGDVGEELEDIKIDELEDLIGELKEVSTTAESILTDNKDEELLLHSSQDALDRFKEKYENRKKVGGTKICDYGFTFLDSTFGGVKNSDLVSILGSAKQFKSTFQRNIAYKALLQAKNVFLVTLEMSFNEIEASFLTMHINNRERFPNFPRITYKEILEAKVPKEYEEYMFEAYNDLISSDDLGVLYILKPIGDYTSERFQVDVNRVETKYMRVDLAMVDSINLMHGGDVSEVDRAIRDMRQFSLGYKSNNGLPVMSPFQIKRSAYEEAVRAEGNLYTTDAVRYFSEVNTSSTRVITTIQTPEMRETSTIQVQCLLSRDTAEFPPTLLRVDAEIGVIEEMSNLISIEDESEIDDETLDEVIRVTSSALFDD